MKYDSLFGEALLLTTEEGVCGFHFLDKPMNYYLQLAEQKLNVSPEYAPPQVQDRWKHICLSSAALSLVVQGTIFQRAVWKALCSIPVGTTCSYQALSAKLGSAQSARAVANAVAQNFIAWLIPCHRAIRQDGQIGGYRWGVSRKAMLLEHEKML